jgi:tripartite-type tricarboxylate transporter receptor subunit TctC
LKLLRRQLLHMAAAAAALPAVSRLAWAQTYPTRPVRLIVGWPPGGAADLFARLIGQPLSERLGQPFIIENRPGAGSNMATEAVVRAPPDGYTLLQISSVNAFNATLYDNLRFDFVRDIAPVASIYSRGCVARHPYCGRLRAGLRGNGLAGGWRTQEHPCRDHRKAQPGDQRCARRS